jgi:hypothetical protein
MLMHHDDSFALLLPLPAEEFNAGPVSDAPKAAGLLSGA